MNAGTSAPPIGTAVELPLGESPRDVAVARLLAVPPRDLLIDERLPPALHCVADALLVDVSIDGRRVLPGAWVEPRVLTQGRPVAGPAVTASDLRLPAVVLGEGRHAVLAWGATVWPLPFDDSVAIPESCRPHPHSPAVLRRLTLIAAGRRDEVGLTLWRDPSFEVPWRDVRLVPRASWWFELAQVPAHMRYRDALAAQFPDA